MTNLPPEFVDAHHHFLDTTKNDFQSFLGSLLPNVSYLPADYEKDVIAPLKQKGVIVVGSVHVECMPNDGAAEAAWVGSLSSTTSVKAIVGSCNLASSSSVHEELQKLKDSSPKVRGVRWILDCVGKFEPINNSATHVATSRHDGIDYLRGSEGGYEGNVVPEFEEGFSLLEKHQLSFDLQCAPVQLLAAAKLFTKYPNIPVCIDHLGKPRTLLGPDDTTNIEPNRNELAVWRTGMRAMAALPHVHVKISMLGYAIPGWIRTAERIQLMKEIVREVIELFTPSRCMVALNWWKDGPTSDSDFLSTVGPGPVEFLGYMVDFFEGYSKEDRDRLFAGTAREFYRF